MLLIVILSILLIVSFVFIYMKIEDVTTLKIAYKSCVKDSSKNKIKYDKYTSEIETRTTESETKHEKEINLIKNKLDRLIKKDLNKFKKLNKEKYYKLFEKMYDVFNLKMKKVNLTKHMKKVKTMTDLKFKGTPFEMMRKVGLEIVKNMKKNFSSVKSLERSFERTLGYYVSEVLKEKVNLRDVITKKADSSYKKKIRNDITNNDFVRKLCFVYLIIKNELIKTSKKAKNKMTDSSLIKLYNELPFGKSVFDIAEEAIKYFTIDFQLDFLKYLDKNNGFFLKSEINHIIDILEVIMNISFNANISKFMTQEQFMTFFLFPISETPFFAIFKDDIIDTLGKGNIYISRESASPLFTFKNKKLLKIFKNFGYNKNNAILFSSTENFIFLIIDFIIENEILINKLLESISNLSFVKDIKKFKSIIDDIKNKVMSVIEILSLYNNTPKKYLKDLRFLFSVKI